MAHAFKDWQGHRPACVRGRSLRSTARPVRAWQGVNPLGHVFARGASLHAYLGELFCRERMWQTVGMRMRC